MKADHMRRELSRIDRIDAPDLLSDIQRRTELGAPSVEPKALGPRTGFGRVALVLGVVTAVVASSLVLSRVFPDGEPATPGGGDLVGSIVLGIRDDGGVTRLYVVEPDGSGSREIGSLGSEARIRGASVSISPDGTRAAFIRFGEDDRGLWVSNVDGSDAVRLSEATPNSDFEPAWSPDGTKIVFSRNRVGHGELFVIDADGSNLTQITTNEVGQDASPAWSPDGSRITFARNSGGPVDIWVVDAVGGNEGQLTTFSEKESGGPDYPDWSPDGRRIVFAAVAPNAASGDSPLKPHDLWMIDADGSNLTRLTDTPEDEIHPRWSPDGGSVVYLIGAGVDPTTVDIRGPYRTAILDVVTGETRSLDAPTGNVVETTLQWIRTTPLQTAETPLTGKALADSLNLELLAEKPPDCMDFVEVADPAGYCIEDVVVRGSRNRGLGRLPHPGGACSSETIQHRIIV